MAEASARYQRIDQPALALGSGKFQVGAHMLDAFEAEIWSACEQYAPLNRHRANIAARLGLPGAEAGGVDAVLSELVAAGLLVSDRWLQQPEGQGSGAESIGVVTVLAYEQPDLTRRTVDELLAGSVRRRPGTQLIIADDSRRGQGIGPLSVDAHWINRGHRESYCQAIANPELAQAARTLLLGLEHWRATSVGANMNTARLAAVGQNILSLDHDMRGPLGLRDVDRGRAVRVMGEGDPTELLLFRDFASALRGREIPDQDLLEVHEAVLGAEVLQVLGGDADLRLATVAVSSQLKARGRVLISSCGLVGDSAMGSPFSYLLLQGPAGQRFAQDYSALRLSRQVHRAAPALTLAFNDSFMSYCTGIAARQLLPPHLPFGRNHDAQFAAATRRLYPESPIAHLPHSVVHAPPIERKYQESDQLAILDYFNTGAQLYTAMACWRPGVAEHTAQQRLMGLARHLQGLGCLPESAYCAWVLEQSRAAQAGRLWALHAQLEWVEGRWAQEIEQAIEVAEQSLRNMQLRVRPGDLSPAQVQAVLRAYGQALLVWPDLLAYAAETPLRGEILPASL